jgi:hypothetical protein
MLLQLMLACTGKSFDSGNTAFTFPGIEAMPILRGPGGPNVSFDSTDLFTNCASLRGGENDSDHHNLVLPYRGHLVLPWAPEWGRGGLSFFDMSDPCQPEKVGEGFHERMRESHTIGFMYISEEEQYALTAGVLGIQFWDISTLEEPEMINYMEIEGVFYPDSYTRVVLSTYWQYPWIYIAAADNGIFIVNAEDPNEPEYIGQYIFDPPLRAAGVFAMGTQLLVTSAEGNQAEILDISDPSAPQPIGGGRFTSVDGSGTPYEAYHANLVGNWALFARKEDGGGIIAMDVSDPSNPSYLWDVHTEGGNSGYVFYDEGYAFLGDSHWGKVFDVRDTNNIIEVGTGNLPGDLDTLTPYGNVAILSVDDEAEDDISSAVMPWHQDIDTTGPIVLRTVPDNGEENVSLTARIGIGFNELIEPSSVFAGSIQLFDQDGNAIDGWGSVQESIATYSPKEPLQQGTTYRLHIIAGGVQDINGNPTSEEAVTTFQTLGIK